jgi:serine/threonine protein kinase
MLRLLAGVGADGQANTYHDGRNSIVRCFGATAFVGPNDVLYGALVLGREERDLRSLLSEHANADTRIDAALVKHITRRLLLALDYMAERGGVVSTDIKPENILISADPDKTFAAVRICDFGCAKLCGEYAPGPFGSLDYAAPETMINYIVDAPADVWSLGTVVYEMVTGATMFEVDFSESGVNSAVGALTYVTCAYFYRVAEHLGPAPAAFAAGCPRYFRADGTLTATPTPARKKDKYAAESSTPDSAYNFVSRCVRYLAADRAAVRELNAHPWLALATD